MEDYFEALATEVLRAVKLDVRDYTPTHPALWCARLISPSPP